MLQHSTEGHEREGGGVCESMPAACSTMPLFSALIAAAAAAARTTDERAGSPPLSHAVRAGLHYGG